MVASEVEAPASVALVSEHASPLARIGSVDAGGQNVHVAALAAELGRRGATVVVYTRRDDPGLPRRVSFAPGVTVEHVDAGPPTPLAKDDLYPFMREFADHLERAWRRCRPNLVHAHFWMSGVAALRAARRLRIPVVLTFHALGTIKRRHLGSGDSSPARRTSAERALATNVDAVAATSSEEVAELARSRARPRRLRMVPCGVDTDTFRPEAPARGSMGRRLVVLGRLVERKGVDDVIRSLPRLPEVRLAVGGGDGTPGDADALRLAALAHRLRVADRVEFLGPVPREAVPALLRSANVVVCAPWYEPFGLVALEAMACGVPVVASAVGGLLDTVVDHETGIHVPPRDPHQLATALRALLEDDRLRARLGAMGAQRAVSRFTWRHVTDELLQLYRDVCG